MKLKINGEIKNFEGVLTVNELLKSENVEMPDMVTVQLNGEFLERDTFATLTLNDGDEVDFLYFMGGGAIV